ncbi:hypothetical protein E2562_003081 [Oryza meyeriana var. granulata]|uniref:Uncharacterized protein n=1 Tax=Oryza meyeriana var. granulata TaxID=110450 RepID=A0A6G1EBG2_9ORYZ|nr:hypothetical protein E2562_003081 [Oryza meyeriana var. granulata]
MEAAEAALSSHEALVKVGVFVLVQALVYVILAQSSAVFSRTKSLQGLRPARSVSVRRMLAALSDMPAGGEPSPVDGRQSPVAVNGRKKD